MRCDACSVQCAIVSLWGQLGLAKRWRVEGGATASVRIRRCLGPAQAPQSAKAPFAASWPGTGLPAVLGKVVCVRP